MTDGGWDYTLGNSLRNIFVESRQRSKEGIFCLSNMDEPSVLISWFLIYLPHCWGHSQLFQTILISAAIFQLHSPALTSDSVQHVYLRLHILVAYQSQHNKMLDFPLCIYIWTFIFHVNYYSYASYIYSALNPASQSQLFPISVYNPETSSIRSVITVILIHIIRISCL